MTRGWLVSGAVQGVGYRYFVRKHALPLKLSGWARNLPDGRVEVVASGVESAIDQLEVLLGRGPVHGRVSHVDKFEISDEVDRAISFEIR